MKSILLTLGAFVLLSPAFAYDVSEIAEEIRQCSQEQNLSEETCSNIVLAILSSEPDSELKLYESYGYSPCKEDDLVAELSIPPVAMASSVKEACIKLADEAFPVYISKMLSFSIDGQCGETLHIFDTSYQPNFIDECVKKITAEF